jgi:PKD repeat protein
MTAQQCTDGWQYVSAAAGSAADHAYYLELRDRSGFDFDGHGQADRGPITWTPGLYLMYTDEAHGYGNVGTDDPPAQTPLDQHPEPGSDTPNLDDAAFNQGESFSDGGAGHVDNYLGADGANWTLKLDCLSFAVDRMSGDGAGPATAPGDLSATVSFTLGSGCGTFDYGYATAAAGANAKPTAVAQARPASANVNQPVQFDGSGSSDDHDAPGDLAYRWDFGDGSPAASGQSVSHAYARAGTFTATLTVTDKGGLSATATVSIAVAQGQAAGGTATSSASAPGGGPTAAAAPPAAAPAAPAVTTTGVAGVTKTVVHLVKGTGVLRRAKPLPRARFTVATKRLVYTDRRRHVAFRSTTATVRYAGRTATIRGKGVFGGKRVRYTAVVHDGGAGRRDTFRLRLSNGFASSARLVYGNVTVR